MPKTIGIPDLLSFVTDISEHLPDLDSVMSSRAQSVGEKFAAELVRCLTSSKGETRLTSEALLKSCLLHRVISASTVQKATESLLPAQQRTVAPIILRLKSSINSAPQPEKEQVRPKEGNTKRSVQTANSLRGDVSSTPKKKALGKLGKGHAGVKGNELADTEANEAALEIGEDAPPLGYATRDTIREFLKSLFKELDPYAAHVHNRSGIWMQVEQLIQQEKTGVDLGEPAFRFRSIDQFFSTASPGSQWKDMPSEILSGVVLVFQHKHTVLGWMGRFGIVSA